MSYIKRSSIVICTLAAGLFLNTTVLGQTNFSGTWSLQNKELVAGPDYDNAVPKKITMHQQSDSLIIESINVGEAGTTVNSRHAIAMNGQPVTSTSATSQRKLVKSLKWINDKRELELTTVYYQRENPSVVDATRVEIFSISPNGKQLNIHKKSTETQSESWEVKGIYEKQ